ncbi:hypothetical protein FE782_31795 [Paenibacillus antri]|uniref:Uncharacterized protein n=1 Tax=Paenibacillus antri TaxID=2582848 RepID=A0A5R9G1R6_9BACL|nr:hypothetical protein [Paenibacillus antri]TLS48246.1 hypothetical protein FE782_31795 [Paenibacillus antri]
MPNERSGSRTAEAAGKGTAKAETVMSGADEGWNFFPRRSAVFPFHKIHENPLKIAVAMGGLYA